MDWDRAHPASRLGRTLSRRAFLGHATTGAALALSIGPAGHLAAAARHGPAVWVPDERSIAQTADIFLKGLVADRSFRGSVLIARRGHVILSKGYDWADVARRVPNTPRTRFRIASITKQFTAMAILQLQDQGKLHVHDHLSAYLSPCPAAWRPITLHQLLTHTSGIPDYTNLPSYTSIMTRTLTREQLLALFRDKPLDFRPGTRWRYSNSGYAMLGIIVERVSGLSYAAFLQRHIFTPLRLANTSYDVNHPALPGHATGYATWERPAAYIDMSVPFANGCLYSTTEDLYRWDQALTSGHPALVSRQALRQMFTPYVPLNPADPHAVAYGYGWFIGYEGAHREIEHTGDINGFISANQFYPDDHLTVIYLSNLETDRGLRGPTLDLAGIALGYADCAHTWLPCSEL
jgi:CubicO group peptidase (beta-lactamase class C family)